ncbi:MAG: hypothetical protein IPL33_21085 [Sphingobacteriales bacterium]|nr:hypothetical protein [Sphingobacteriales bacterium]
MSMNPRYRAGLCPDKIALITISVTDCAFVRIRRCRLCLFGQYLLFERSLYGNSNFRRGGRRRGIQCCSFGLGDRCGYWRDGQPSLQVLRAFYTVTNFVAASGLSIGECNDEPYHQCPALT